jgi:hypothetical protein
MVFVSEEELDMITQNPSVVAGGCDAGLVAANLRLIADKIEAHELVACAVAICDKAREPIAALYVDRHGTTFESLDQMAEATYELARAIYLVGIDLLEMRSDESKPLRH